MSGALVLAGGGVAGIAWEVGVLRGIQQVEPSVIQRIFAADSTLVGTSAGSVVASQLAGGVTLRELFDEQFAAESAAVGAPFDAVAFGQTIAQLLEGATSALDGRKRVGRFALDSKTMLADERRHVLAERLRVQIWPEARLLITAVDAETGELRVFDRDSGVPLLDAVGASCAVPGVWPTVTINGHRYTDGGVRTIANADLAAGCDPVLILVPQSETLVETAVSAWELRALEPAAVQVVCANSDSIAAFGNNPLDSATSAASATAGLEQGMAIARKIAAFWP